MKGSRRWLALLGVLVVAGLVAAVVRLSDGPDGSDRRTQSDGSESSRAELPDGLVVPAGASLVGPTFPDVARTLDSSPGWTAVLAIDDDPFDVWDLLADEVTDLGPRVPSSGLSCMWVIGADTDANVLSGLTGDGAPEGTEALRCEAIAVGTDVDANGEALEVSMQLWSDEDSALIGLQLDREARGPEDTGTTRYGEDGLLGPEDVLPEEAPPSSADRTAVPHPDAPIPEPGAGDSFGTEVNCIDSGYGRLRVPPGASAQAVSGPGVVGRDYVAVLTVDDAESAMRDLATQMGDKPTGTSETLEPHREALPNGQEVWVLDHSVEAGGGSCHARTDPSGRAILIIPYSD